VGGTTEKKIWADGIPHWDAFLDSETAGPLKGKRKSDLDSHLETTRTRTEKMDLPFLSGLFKGCDSWRLWDSLKDGAVFLDIETTGTRRYSPITVVGTYDRNQFRTAIRKKDLSASRIREILSPAKILVTFNGSAFDIPMIEHQFPGSVPEVPHLDLRFLARKCGHSGGLKAIEIRMGISRPEDVKGMSGEDAVRLWRSYERDGNRNALKLLLKYNLEDIVNLEPLAETLIEDVRRREFDVHSR
jgi:hypothetical protein